MSLDLTDTMYKPFASDDMSTWSIPVPAVICIFFLYTTLPVTSAIVSVAFVTAASFHWIYNLLFAGLGKAAIVEAVLLTLCMPVPIGVIVLETVCCIKPAVVIEGAAAVSVTL